MPKQYTSTCIKHENETLKSYVGEDLDKFRERMKKGGHEVGELKNADYKLTDRGYKLMSELFDAEAKVAKILEELDKEYEKIVGLVDHEGLGIIPVSNPEKPKIEPVLATPEATPEPPKIEPVGGA